MTDEELVKALRGWDHCWPAPWLERAVTEAAERIETLTVQLESTLKDRAAIILERGSAFRQRDVAVAFGTWCLDKLAALELERDALREDLEELDFLRHEGGPDSVAAMEAELKRLRAVLSDIKTASVCSVSRNVAASALGEAAI